MRKASWLAGTMAAVALAGCSAKPSPVGPALTPIEPVDLPVPATQSAATTAPAAAREVIAVVGSVKIDRAELNRPLLEAYGFNTLMLLIQRDMAHQACAEAGLVVTPVDIANEWKWTLDIMFSTASESDDRQKLLDQYLAQPKAPGQASTRAEMNIIIDTNAYLRKLAEPSMRVAITDDVVRQAFDEQYGAQVRVRHIALANPQLAMKYKAAIEDGQDFATLARHVSLNEKSGQVGGELPPFTINSSALPTAFKQAAFALKVGEISEPVAAGGAYHLIKLEERIQPKAVKFEDVKDSVREDLQQKAVLKAVKSVRGRLAQQALEQMRISDPVLRTEFEKRLGVREATIKDSEKMKQQMEKERAAAAAESSTLPANAAPAAVSPAGPPNVKSTQPASAASDPIIAPVPPAPGTKPAPAPTPSATPSSGPAAAPSPAPPVAPAPPVVQPTPTTAIAPAPARAPSIPPVTPAAPPASAPSAAPPAPHGNAAAARATMPATMP